MVAAIKIPTREQIAERAYFLYLERGATSGYDVEDWLAAESELSGHGTNEQADYRDTEPSRRDKALAATRSASS